MREILFRGKRLDNGEWVEGLLARFNPMFEVANIVGVGEILVPVLTSTVGQYIGMNDKNGKRIFEGDLVSTDLGRPFHIVEYRDGCFMFNCNDGGRDYYDIMFPILDEPQSYYKYGEVIGNIHDNPELLEVRHE